MTAQPFEARHYTNLAAGMTPSWDHNHTGRSACLTVKLVNTVQVSTECISLVRIERSVDHIRCNISLILHVYQGENGVGMVFASNKPERESMALTTLLFLSSYM